MSRFSIAAIIAGSLVVAAPTLVWAEDDEANQKQVQAYLDRATDRFKANDFEAALQALRSARKLTDLAVIDFNIARCLEELQRDAEAVAAFEAYLAKNDTTAGAPALQKRARETVARLKATLPPPVAPAPAFGTLEVSCTLPDSTVMVAGITQTPSPCPWRSDHVAPGSYEVTTQARGGRPVVVRTEVRAGATTIIGQPAIAAVSGAPAPSANLVPVKFVAAREGDLMYVIVDGNPELACTAPCELRLIPGGHTVDVAGAATYRRTVGIPKDSASVASIGRSKGGYTALIATSFAVGTVATILGLSMVVAANDSTSAVYQDSGLETAGWVTAGAGAAIAITGGIIGFALRGSNSVDIKPDVAPNASADRSMFSPKLVSWGIAPMKDGGGMAGATFVF